MNAELSERAVVAVTKSEPLSLEQLEAFCDLAETEQDTLFLAIMGLPQEERDRLLSRYVPHQWLQDCAFSSTEAGALAKALLEQEVARTRSERGVPVAVMDATHGRALDQLDS